MLASRRVTTCGLAWRTNGLGNGEKKFLGMLEAEADFASYCAILLCCYRIYACHPEIDPFRL